MLVLVQRFFDICWHRESDFVVGIFTIKCDTTDETAFPVDGDCVKVLEGVDEMVGVLLDEIFDTEIADYKE